MYQHWLYMFTAYYLMNMCCTVYMYLYLDVPVCKSVQPMIYGVSKRELVNVLCEVEANPADVEFRWTFNNSAELIKVPTARPENNFSTSLLR